MTSYPLFRQHQWAEAVDEAVVAFLFFQQVFHHSVSLSAYYIQCNLCDDVVHTGVWSSLNGDGPAVQPLPTEGQFDDPESTSHTNLPATEEHIDHDHDSRPRGPSFDLPVHQPRRQRKDFNLDQPYQQSDDHHHSTTATNRKSFDKDAKGKDWTCICGNLNWSWRSHCNTCQNAKPANLLVR